MDVGLIGVGHIGKEFVDRLGDTDHSLTVFDVDDEQVADAVERGATAVDSPAEVAERSETVLFALPGTDEVEATIEADGFLDNLSAGGLVIDASTTHPDASVACERTCDERGVGFLEAPITGAAPREGYQMMIGGAAENYERAADLLDVLCDDHVRVGPVPKGTVFKLALQLRYAGRTALDAEIVEFARDSGVDPRLLNDFLDMDVSERLFDRAFAQGIEGLGSLAIWHKDVGYARSFAADRGTALPLAGAVHEAYKAGVRHAADGAESAGGSAVETDEEAGHAASILRYWELLNRADER